MAPILILISLIISLTAIQGSTPNKGRSVSIDISPEKTLAVLSVPINITCDVIVNVKEIVLISISKDNRESIVSMGQRSIGVSYGKKNGMRYQAEGAIDPAADRKYLSLVLQQPTVEDAGNYTCSVKYFAEDFTFQQDEASSKLIVNSDLNLKQLETILGQLMSKVSNLERENTHLWQEINGLSDKESIKEKMKNHSQQITYLEARISNQSHLTQELQQQDISHMNDLESIKEKMKNHSQQITYLEARKSIVEKMKNHSRQIAHLEARNSNHSRLIQDLRNDDYSHMNDYHCVMDTLKEESQRITKLEERALAFSATTVAFTATITSDLDTQHLTHVVFPKTLIQQGRGYDNKTGIFTAPRAGFYVFYLAILMGNDEDGGFLSIQKNDVHNLATVYAHDYGRLDYSSCSAWTNLKVGDKVQVVVGTAHRDGPGPYLKPTSDISNFSGYLMKPL